MTPRRLVLAQTDLAWRAWQAAHLPDPPAARIGSVDDVRNLTSGADVDPAGWQVQVAGTPDTTWLMSVTSALRDAGFTVPRTVFTGEWPYR